MAPIAGIGFETLRPALYPLRADFLPNELQPRLPFVKAGFFLLTPVARDRDLHSRLLQPIH
jgi:hypothetical protein